LADTIYNLKIESGFWLDSQKEEKNSGSVMIGDKLSSLICCCRKRGGNWRWGGLRGGHGTWSIGGVKHGEADVNKWPRRSGSRVMPVKEGYPGLWSQEVAVH
jgi:hypothetical protein